MGRIGLPEIIFILLIIVLLFGAKKLPEIASSLGKAVREFLKAGKDIKEEIKEVTEDNGNESKKA